ncbi:MAG: hypothetical protein V1775_05000 [Bacteroidota bacterium]
MRKIICLLPFMFLSVYLSAQERDLTPVHKPLITLLDSIHRVKSDSLRLLLNLEFYEKLYRYATENISKGLNLDSVKISNVASDDGHIRVLSWNIQQNNGDNIYSGLIIHKLLKSVIRLKASKSEPVVDSEKTYLNGEWPAGIIYRIIQRKFHGRSNYTLLIWDGFDKRVSRKSIESLSFDGDHQAVFGAPVFKIREGVRNRIIYEYSSNASFTLQYSRQKVNLSGVRKSQSKINDEMIVLDRLIPLNDDLKGQRWAYVPAGNTYDAFIYFEGFWTLTEDIIARNEPTRKSESKKGKKAGLNLLPEEK